jgi:hypothetical protein
LVRIDLEDLLALGRVGGCVGARGSGLTNVSPLDVERWLLGRSVTPGREDVGSCGE